MYFYISVHSLIIAALKKMSSYPPAVAGGVSLTVQVRQQSRGVHTLKVQAGLKEKTYYY